MGTDVSYEKDHDLEAKLHCSEHIHGTIHRTLHNKTRKETRIKLYKTMATPILKYGSGLGLHKKREGQDTSSWNEVF